MTDVNQAWESWCGGCLWSCLAALIKGVMAPQQKGRDLGCWWSPSSSQGIGWPVRLEMCCLSLRSGNKDCSAWESPRSSQCASKIRALNTWLAQWAWSYLQYQSNETFLPPFPLLPSPTIAMADSKMGTGCGIIWQGQEGKERTRHSNYQIEPVSVN